MTEYSVLVGGRAGDGIAQAGQIISSLFSARGYHVYQYIDYPSLIRGGHNYCIIRASNKPIFAHRSGIDLIIALDQHTVDLHRNKITNGGVIIYDKDRVKTDGHGLSIKEILKKHGGKAIMANSAMIGGFCGVFSFPWDIVTRVLQKKLPKEVGINLDIAKDAYESVSPAYSVEDLSHPPRPFMSGNEWIGLGLLAGGIDAYIAYPMTPASSVLHFLAGVADEAGIEVYHPESEIAVILMAQGFAYAGKKTAVGTSGGGFCLMTEGLSLAGQTEIPIVILLAQRAGPSTGIPTYTSQADLLFACHAGQGEFPRYIVAPATPEEAMLFGSESVYLSWRYQVPAIILSDKTFSEGYYTIDTIPDIRSDRPLPAASFPYKRYANTPDGISPMISPPMKGEIVKVNSYTHDYAGITTEDPKIAEEMVKKTNRKIENLKKATDRDNAVYIGGNNTSSIALVSWGSTRGVALEVAELNDLRLISPIVLNPFPKKRYSQTIEGVKRFILVEDSSSGQLDKILNREGFEIHDKILKFDGRPFSVEELDEQVRRCLQ